MAERGQPGVLTRRRLLLGMPLALPLAAGLLCRAEPVHATRKPSALNGVLQWLPGRYESSRAELFAVPVYAPRAGAHVFYLRIEVLDAPLDALTQSLLAVTAGRRSRCMLQEWRLVEPRRWRDAHLSPDVFKSLVPDDLAPGPVANLDWDSTVTRVVSAPGSAFRFELDPTAITFTERYERR